MEVEVEADCLLVEVSFPLVEVPELELEREMTFEVVEVVLAGGCLLL